MHSLAFKHIESHHKWPSHQPTNWLGEIMQVEVVRPCQYLAFPNFGHTLHILIGTSFKSQKRLHLCIQIFTCSPTAFPSLNHQLLSPKKLMILQVESNISTVLPFSAPQLEGATDMEQYKIYWKPPTVASACYGPLFQATYATTFGHQCALPISPADIHFLNVTTHILRRKEKNVHFLRLWQNNASAFQ